MIELASNLSSPSARLCGGLLGAAVFGLPAVLWLRTGEVRFSMRSAGVIMADRASDPQQFWGAVGVFILLSLACLAVASLGLSVLRKEEV